MLFIHIFIHLEKASSWMFGRVLSLPLPQIYLGFLLLGKKLSNFHSFAQYKVFYSFSGLN